MLNLAQSSVQCRSVINPMLGSCYLLSDLWLPAVELCHPFTGGKALQLATVDLTESNS